MKTAVMVLCALACAVSAAERYSTVKTLCAERYEENAGRSGAARLTTGYVAPGLLQETGMGVYETDSSVPLKLSRDEFDPPQGARVRLVHSLRIYGFKGARSSLMTELKGFNRTFSVKVLSPENGTLPCRIAGDGMKEETLPVPVRSLPAEFALYIGDDGGFSFVVSGLSDSSSYAREGKTALFGGLWKDGYGYRPLGVSTVFASSEPGRKAEITVDEHIVALAAPAKKVDVPCIVKPAKTFDPVKEGWPLVFADEFNGDSIDWTKWYHRGRNCSGVLGKHTRVDGKGVLEIEADYGKDGKTLESASLRSKREFVYGYFEAKVKLTRQNGWWAAFWMYGRINSDPFVDGLEIDIFEDYYTRKMTPQGKNRLQLDHNLHMYLGDQLKSWNYNSELEGDIDDWVVIGCKWTPFEISYYVNGRLLESAANHSNWPSVTYDAINHAVATAPLHLIVSGQVMGKSWPWFDKTGAKFPETYKVDYVRAYAMPEKSASLPSVEWRGAAAEDDGTLKFFDEGEKMRFEVAPSVSAKSGAGIACVYLYDAGYLIGYKKEAPYVFDVELTKDWYSRTRYMSTGRQKVVPDFAKAPHSFVAFVQDESGAVARTAKVIRRHPKFFNPATRPYEGIAQKLPGRIMPWRYDEGGQKVAYYDTTKGNAYSRSGQARRTEGDLDCTASEIASIMPGEWVNYTVDIAEAGPYRAEMRYGTAMQGRHAVHVVVDGKTAGVFSFEYTGDADSWSLDKSAVIEKLELPAGRHVVSFYFHAQLNIGSFVFRRAENR